MDISISYVQGRQPSAVLGLKGDLDGSSYLQVIDKAREAYAEGARAIVLDLSETGFVSSAGLVAIHSAALILQGLVPPDPEHGWAAIRSVGQGSGNKARESLKIAGPQPRVALTLDKVGFKDALEIYATVDEAVATL